jgi:hypothetical protein
MINFKKHSDPFGSLGIGKSQIIHKFCKVGDNGEKNTMTCRYLARYPEGYFCLKLSKYKEAIDTIKNYQVGDYCDGIDENIKLAEINYER